MPGAIPRVRVFSDSFCFLRLPLSVEDKYSLFPVFELGFFHDLQEMTRCVLVTTAKWPFLPRGVPFLHACAT